MNTAPQSAWRSPWVIGWIAMVAVVLVANITMVLLAVNTNPGLVVKDYYERGRHFERTRSERQTIDAGWEGKLDVPEQAVAGRPATYRFAGVDRQGLPLRAEAVILFAYRPSDARADFSTPMVLEAPGRYRAEVAFPLKGVWDLLVSVRHQGKEHNLARRVSVLGPQ